MPDPMHSLVSYIRFAAGAWKDDPRDDPELLTRFAATRDEAAFATLIWRHGAMVWRTCKNILGNKQDTEDAFQNVFLALARKAGQSAVKSPAGWLHKVARRTALDARRTASRHPQDSRHQALDETQPERVENTDRIEQYAVLDEELARLPEKLRVPLVLRYLEEKTQDEVAHILGCSRFVARKRMEQGEAMLRKRLEQRGLALGVTTIAALLGKNDGIPIVSGRLIESTARTAVSFRAGTLTGVGTEAAQKLLRALSMEGVKGTAWWVVLAFIGMLGVGGAGWVVWKMCGDGSDTAKPAGSDTHKTVVPMMVAEQRGKRVDLYGDLLPDGALSRIGTLRFRTGMTRNGTSILDRHFAAFSPDGKTLITFQNGERSSPHCEKFVHFWETGTGKELCRLEGPGQCWNLAVSSDGKELAVIGSGGVWAWDLGMNPPRKIFCYDRHNRMIEGAAAFSPDGTKLGIACPYESTGGESRPRATLLFDLATGKLVHEFPCGVKMPEGWRGLDREVVAFSHNGKILATGDTALWDVTTGTKKHDLKTDRETEGYIQSLAFSPDDKMLATVNMPLPGGLPGSWDKKCIVSLWDTVTGLKIRQMDGVPIRYGSFVAFLPDGQTLMQGGLSGVPIQFWDPATGKVKSPPQEIAALAKLSSQDIAVFSPDYNLKVQSDGPHLVVTEISTKRRLGPQDVGIGSNDEIVFTPDGSLLLTKGTNNSLRSWEAHTGRPCSSPLQEEVIKELKEKMDIKHRDVRDLRIPDALRVTYPRMEERQEWIGRAHCMVFSTDERSILTCHYSRLGRDWPRALVEVWSMANREDWSKGWPKAKRLINLTNSEIPFQKRWPARDPAPGQAVSLSPDGRRVAIVLGDSVLRLLEVASGSEKEVGKFEIAEGAVALEWSSDGCLLAAGDEKGDVWLWDAFAKQEVGHFTGGHRGWVSKLAFSPDGRRLASSSSDTTALVWDLSNLPRRKVETIKVPPADDLWDDLRKWDAAEASQAMFLLTQNPDASLPLLRKQLRLGVPLIPDPKMVEVLLTQLADNDFQMRNQAEERLVKLGKQIESALREVLTKKNPELEVRVRLERTLEKISSLNLNQEQLQAYRGVEVLERIGTPEARQVLEELSRLPVSGCVQVDEAKSALHRLSKIKTTPTTTP